MVGLTIAACSPRAEVVAQAVAGTLTAAAPPTSVLPAGRSTSTLVPTVIATLPPLPTPTPTPVVEDPPTPDPGVLVLGDLIYAEEFDTPGPWSVGETEANIVSVDRGVLSFTQKTPGTFAFRITGRQANDFYAQLSTQVVGPCRTGDRYGLIYRLQDGNNYYLFLLNCAQQYRVVRVTNGALEPLNDWTPNGTIRPDSSAVNAIGVRARGAQVDFFINEEHAFGTSDSAFGGGRFGVWVGAGATTNFTVEFDDLELYSLPVDTPAP